MPGLTCINITYYDYANYHLHRDHKMNGNYNKDVLRPSMRGSVLYVRVTFPHRMRMAVFASHLYNILRLI